MTAENPAPYETLKDILRQSRNPELLDDHPWTQGLFVQEALESNPQLGQASPGGRLVGAIAELFPQLKPANPPRRGLRLDPRWGEFGLLAALYFMPYHNGSSFPSSLLDAWGRIDPAILYFVYGKPADALGEGQAEQYRLVGDDLEYGAASTLSDWHRKGLQRLAELIFNRERFLARTSTGAPGILPAEGAGSLNRIQASGAPGAGSRKHLTWNWRTFWVSLALCLVVALGFGALKAWKIYERGRLVYRDVNHLRALLDAPLGAETLDRAAPALETLQTDLAEFGREAQPLLWLSPGLAWAPVYGGDLAAAPELLGMTEHLLDGSVLALQAARPLLSEFDARGSTLGPAGLTELLVQAQPGLLEARAEFDRALAARAALPLESLSPRLQTLLLEELDPLLEMADEGLSLATALPRALGATGTGPKTYLLLVQNEDELRPTGGFITSVGNLVLHNGQVISLDFEGVDNNIQEDWTKPYPAAPWQLQEYMNSRVLIFRDSNWFSDYPTSALWAEYLYAYTHSHSVDGVIAFDQQFLVILLGQLGPLEVEGAPYAITAQNVQEYMRAAKEPPAGEEIPEGWYRKEFIGELAGVVLTELTGGQDKDWRGLAEGLTQALAERHLLLQFDDPELAALLAEHGWDGALRPGEGDFLMLTDSNIGFNKTSALVDVSLSYDVDLSDPAQPEATLVVTHKNNADPDVPCIQWETGEISGEDLYPVNRCYWNYLRVYKQQGVELLEASPHAIPGEWMLLGRGVPARVDELEEEIPGVRGFGTLLVVPGGQSWNTGFEFALPPAVLARLAGSNEFVYRLRVQKQPGTRANPLTVRVHLPNRAQLESVSLPAEVQDRHILIKTDLRTDVELEIVFSLP